MIRIASHSVHMMGTFNDLQVEAAKPETFINDAVAQLRLFNQRLSENTITTIKTQRYFP